jgi:hypothetical protein
MLRVTAAIIFASSLWAADPWIGTWELDIAKSRISGPEVLNGVEATFTDKEGGWLICGDVQYRRDGQVLRRQISIRLDGAEHQIPEKPGFSATSVRVDEVTIQQIEKTAGRVARIITYHVLPDGTLLRLVHVFKPDGTLAADETQFFHRK